MAGDCCSTGSRLRHRYGSPTVSCKGSETSSGEPGSRSRSSPRVRVGRRCGASRIFGSGLRETLPPGHANAVPLATSDSGAIGTESQQSFFGPENPTSCSPTGRVWSNHLCGQPRQFLSLSDVRPGRGILGSRTGQCGRCRVSEDSRSQRYCLELLDRSVGASAQSACQRFAVENLAGRGSRCRPCPRARYHKHFLALWKDADPDIPILKEAKAEYAKLQ